MNEIVLEAVRKYPFFNQVPQQVQFIINCRLKQGLEVSLPPDADPVLRQILLTRGVIRPKHVMRALHVSYPTARKRIDRFAQQLGLPPFEKGKHRVIYIQDVFKSLKPALQAGAGREKMKGGDENEKVGAKILW